jgi:hypothetical protein
MGIPKIWAATKQWFAAKGMLARPKPESKLVIEKKYAGIPTVEDYNKSQPDEFWKFFPKRPMPNAIFSQVNASKVRIHLLAAKPFLSDHQWKRGLRLIDSLENGANAYQKFPLPPISVPNTLSALKYGEHLTDKIASWVDAGFVAGPFNCPPMPGFRSNTLIAACRNNSVRPIINMSEPKGQSFNDNVKESLVEKVWMCTAKKFSYKVIEAGEGALMSKFDLKDAYKNIPAKTEDWRLQGFQWCGKYFFETKMIFGASPSVANFDILGSTLVELAVRKSGIPRRLVSRALDDIPVLAPHGSNWTYKFGRALKEIAKDCGIRIAENCPENKKAFEHQTEGTVLGIIFNTNKLEWSLSSEKAEKIICKIQEFSSAKYVDLKKTQSVMGVVNDLAQMAPYLRVFKHSGNNLLGSFAGNEEILKVVPNQVKKDLLVCAKLAEEAKRGLPIAHKPVAPPLSKKVFYSDAAGAKFGMHKGNRVNLSIESDRGAACIEILEEEVVWWATITWPLEFLNNARDSKGAYFGSKSATLEMIGVILPFLSIPQELAGKNLVIFVDNMSIVYGWENGYVKNDSAASILIRALQLISMYLGAPIYIEHVGRCSNKWATMADSLSRRSTTTIRDRWLLRNAKKSSQPESILKWLTNPEEDWDLPLVLMEGLEKKLKYV